MVSTLTLSCTLQTVRNGNKLHQNKSEDIRFSVPHLGQASGSVADGQSSPGRAAQPKGTTYRKMTPHRAGRGSESVVMLSLARSYAIDFETFARVQSEYDSHQW